MKSTARGAMKSFAFCLHSATILMIGMRRNCGAGASVQAPDWLNVRFVTIACLFMAACGTLGLACGVAVADHGHARSVHCQKHARKHKHHACRHSTRDVKRKKTRGSHTVGTPTSSTQPTVTSSPTQAEVPGAGRREGIYEPCSAATTPTLPTGDGWVTGDYWMGGGPAPGNYYCTPSPVEVIVSNAKGEVVATQQVGKHEYWTIPLAEGSYSLKAYTEGKPVDCPSEPATFTVIVGQSVKDSVVCNIP